jgi:hypothetical protein
VSWSTRAGENRAAVDRRRVDQCIGGLVEEVADHRRAFGTAGRAVVNDIVSLPQFEAVVLSHQRALAFFETNLH